MYNVATVTAGAAILLGVLAGVFALAWHGTISGGEAMTVVTSITAAAAGIFAVHSGVHAGARAADHVHPVTKEEK